MSSGTPDSQSASTAPPRSGRKSQRSSPLVISLLAGGALVVAVVLILVFIRIGADDGPKVPASEMARQYLTALAEGDAQTARSLTSLGLNSDESLLTDEVLAESLELAPITDISVEENSSTKGSAEVPVSFALGDRQVSMTLEIHNLSDEGRLITNGTFLVELPTLQGLDPMVNGASVGRMMTVFPGTYRLELGAEPFTLPEGSGVLTVTGSEDSIAAAQLEPQLSEDGIAEFRSLVRSSLEECLAMTSLSTPCGMDLRNAWLPAGHTPVEDSVKRTLTPEGDKALDSLEPRIDSQRPTVVTGVGGIDVDVTFSAEKDGIEVWYRNLTGAGPNTPSVDFAAETPVVTWN